MLSSRRILALCLAVLALGPRVARADSWAQFRGPNASGVAANDVTFPADVGPDKNVLWKTPLPPGHSSPVISKDRVFITGVKDDTLVTIGLDRATGRALWEQPAPHLSDEIIHSIGSHAQASPATDGEIVVSFFGSSGLQCYDKDGKPLWQKPLGPFKNTYGAASSPLLVDGKVLLNQDHDINSFLLCLDARTGERIWQVEREEFPRGFCTPVIWESSPGKKQVVVIGALRAIGYDLETGAEAWTVRGLARISNMTPVVGSDGLLYIAAWAPGADEGDRIQAEPYDAMLAKYDEGKNGLLEESELPEGPLRSRFPQIDRDKDGQITDVEYEWMREIFHAAENVVLAVKPGGEGDITDTHVLWRESKQLPYVPSPLHYRGLLYLVKNGGILSCRDAETGRELNRGRLKDTGDYYSSPVAGDGKVYLLSRGGSLTVITAESKWKVLATADFGEESFATPALVDGRIYLRAGETLYCCGEN
jgi:outer membrane protein assembly factor BamB